MMCLVGCQGDIAKSESISHFFRGTYELVEWHEDGKIYSRPEVSGPVSFTSTFIHVTIQKKI